MKIRARSSQHSHRKDRGIGTMQLPGGTCERRGRGSCMMNWAGWFDWGHHDSWTGTLARLLVCRRQGPDVLAARDQGKGWLGERGEGYIGGLGDGSTPRCECGCWLSKLSRGVDEDDVDGGEIDGGEDG